MLEDEIGAVLRGRQLTLAVAETTTGGNICTRIVRVPGSSAYFDRGIIAYSKASKLESLGLSKQILDAYGTVSRETTAAMAEAIRALAKTDLGLAESGIAGPIRGRSPKPIGLAYIALATGAGTDVTEYHFEGDREAIQTQIAEHALLLLRDYLLQ